MAGKLADLFVNIGAKTDDLKKGLADVKSQGTALGSTIGKIGGIIAGVFAVERISSFVQEVSQLAQVAEGVEMAFKRIGGAAYLDDLQKATRGTVSDLELMKAAVQAKNFGIPLQNLGSLLEFAHQRAKDTGQSVDYLVNSIVVGIGRKSPLILDNLGISAVQLKEKMKGVGAETASVGDVAKAVGQIASEAMSKVGHSAETTSEKVAGTSASFTNLKVELGKMVNTVTNQVAPAIKWVFDTMANGAKMTQLAIRAIFAGDWVNQDKVDKAVKNWISAFNKMSGTNQADINKNALFNIERLTQFRDRDLKKLEGASLKEKVIYQNKIAFYNDTIMALKALISTENTEISAGEEKNKSLEKQLTLWEKIQKNIKDAADRQEQMSFFTPRELVAPTAIKGKSTGLIPQVGGFETGADQLSKFAGSFQETANVVSESVIEMSSSIGQFVEDFASGIGELLAGTATFDDFGKMILKSVGSFMSALGKQMIALGVAGIAVKLLASNPAALIIAGAALVALGSAVSATMSSSPLSSGSRGTSSSYYSSSLTKQSNTIQIEGELKGTDIYWSLKRTGNKLANTSS